MPCSDGRDNNVRIVYQNGVDPTHYNFKINSLNDKISKLEGGLCAIITELEKKGIANEIISQASKSGLIDLMTFWMHHKNDDISRLANELHKFSKHEQDILRKLLVK